MATLLAALNTGDSTYSYVTAPENWTYTDYLVATEAGYVTQIKLKVKAQQTPEPIVGTLLVRLYDAGANIVGTGSASIAALGGDYTFYSVNISEYPLVESGQSYRLMTQRGSSDNQVLWSRTSDSHGFMWEIWDDGVTYLPAKPTTPTPSHQGTDIKLSWPTLDWESGGNTDTYTVYAGLESENLNEVQSGLESTEIPMPIEGFLDYYTVYYWRVNATNEYGTTTGTEWYFTSIAFDPPLPSGVTISYPTGNPTGDVYGEDNIMTIRKLVAVANSRIWIENI